MDELEGIKPPKRASKKLYLALGVIVLIVITLGTAILLFHARQHSLLDSDLLGVQTSVPFPLFKPNYIPAGYTYSEGSFSARSQIVLFSVTSIDHKTIAITEQSKPNGYDFDQLSGMEEFNTRYGKAYVEDFEVRTTGSLVSDKTWVIVNTQQPIGRDEMKKILNSLYPLNGL